MTQACDVERVIAEDRKLLLRRGDKFILIDLDEKPRFQVNWWAVATGVVLWAWMILAFYEWRR